MIREFREWFNVRFLNTYVLDGLDYPLNFKKHPMEIENPRDHETRKRVAAAFKAQEKEMKARVQKAHSADCLDPLSCDKIICYSFVPDQIVSQEVVSLNPSEEFKYAKLPDPKKVQWALDKEMKKTKENDKIIEQKHED